MRSLLRADWRRFSARVAWGTLGLALAGSSVTPRPAAAAAPSGWKVLETTERGVRLSVEVPAPQLTTLEADGKTWTLVGIDEYSQRGEPGWPQLPSASAWLCVPPQATMRLQTRVLETQSLSSLHIAPVPTAFRDPSAPFDSPSLVERRVEGDAYDSFRVDRADAVQLSAPTFTRKQRLVALTLRPVIYDAATGAAEVVRRVEIDVLFQSVPAATAHSAAAQGGSAGASGPPASDVVVGGKPDNIVVGSLLNPRFAAQWRCLSPQQGALLKGWSGASAGLTPEPTAVRATGDIRPLDPTGLLGPEFRLRVSTSRPTRLVLGDLIARGFPQDVPRRKVRLYQRRWNAPTDGLFDLQAPLPLTADVPFAFLGNPDPDGLVTAADEIYFLGADVRDDEPARTINGQTFPRAVEERSDNWNSSNVFWIAAAEPDGDGWARMAIETLSPAAGTPQVSFPRHDRSESDAFYQDNPDDDANLPRYQSNSHLLDIAQVPVELVHPAPGGDVTVTYTLAARTLSPVAPSVTVALVKATSSQIIGAHTLTSLRLLPFTGIAQVDPFGDGFVTLQIQAGGTQPVLTYLGNISLDYQALYVATRDEARFNTGQVGGSVSLQVTGFTQNDLVVLDVTDPLAPRQIVLAAQNFPATGSLSLEVPQEASQRREFWALRPVRADRVISEEIERAATPAVTADPTTFPDGQAQVLVIGPADLAAASGPWLTWRRAHDREGWSIAYVDVQAVFDQFSGGLKSPTAIKRLIEYAYLKWEAHAVVLMGSASEDPRTVAQGSGPDLVPCPLHVQAVSGQREVLGSDKWYVTFGTDAGYPSTNIHGPDMAIGRLPVRDAADLGTITAKIIAYEQPQATDTWRRRVLWVADDAWSSDTIGIGSSQYCYRTSEEAFRVSQQRSFAWTDSLDTAIQPGDFYLSNYTDPMHPNRDCMDVSGIGTYVNRVQSEVWPQLRARLNDGALLVSYQGHAAYNVLGHEYLMTGDDIPSITNAGRPFVFFGMGCHVSDFLDSHETTNGQSIGQRLLLLPNAGAVATYGSNGYEFLTQITEMMEAISRAMFTRGRLSSPVIGDTVLTQWTLSEVMGQAEHDILPAGVTEREMVAQFHVLGDPLLRLDAAPPRLSLLHEGTPLGDGGELLPAAGANTFALELRGVDETGVSRLLLSDTHGGDWTSSLVPVATGDPRRRTATFELPVLPYGGLLDALSPEGPRGYRVQAQAFDGAYPDVRPTSVSLVVPFTLTVRVNGSDVPEGSGPLSPDADVPVEIEFVSPVSVAQDAIAVAIDAALVTSPLLTALDAEGRHWRLACDGRGDGSGQAQVLHLTLSGIVTDFALTQTATVGQFAIAQHYPFPSPADPEHGPVWFVAQTTTPARFARVTVYDLNGRPIARAQSDAGAPDNEVAVRWNGRDDRGDAIANGVYLYRMEVGDGAALLRSSMGRVVLMR